MPAKISTRGHTSKGTNVFNDSQINIEQLVREVLQSDLIIDTCAKIDIIINNEDISISHRIGKVNNSMGQRPSAIIVRFVRYCTRQMILRNKKKLEREKKCIYTSNGKVMYNDGKKRLELFSIQYAKGLIDDGRD
ncbi:unnamed protein product [Didymodactylos carnosus]|uniref:Uncharacterized protein n=1 Tax=Didymodactylos carnosus TaxID=1234261 RepID=A0A815FW10_9BILA|nr:unnamed protein product [Didymodactylos carnosus]CAF1329946.1 unnamed protein product [Didymodactylos carnosus]CAF3605723.1 unnamed protein product [Didymodactylos carnosus]CAF4182604.1 unnamed protein product [Didymodactylos carnosus]